MFRALLLAVSLAALLSVSANAADEEHPVVKLIKSKVKDEKKTSIRLVPPKNQCLEQCHTKEHSDTFQWEAYTRDIVGPGHGEKARAALGDGPTGGQLRKAALEKAGRMGPGCIR